MGDEWWPTADGGLEYFQHTDERAPFRWSPFRCNEVMRDRPWSVIEDLHDRVAAGKASLDDVSPLSESRSDSDGPEACGLGDNPDKQVASEEGENESDSCRESSNGSESAGCEAPERRETSEQRRKSDDRVAFAQEKLSDGSRSSDLGTDRNGCAVFVVDGKASNGRGAFDESENGLRSSASYGLKSDVWGPSVEDTSIAGTRRASERSKDSKGPISLVRYRVPGNGEPSEGATPGSRKQSERRTFKIELAYSGRHFWGWQKQTGHKTVQDALERALRSVLDDCEGRNGKESDGTASKHNANATVAGRTDRGVSAAGQVVSWYTRCPDVNCEVIAEAISREAPARLRAVDVSQVSRSFHAQFSAKWRHYVYLFPLKGGELQADGRIRMQPPGAAAPHQPRDTVNTIPPLVFSVQALGGMMRRLEGRSISYGSFARDTRADRSRS